MCIIFLHNIIINKATKTDYYQGYIQDFIKVKIFILHNIIIFYSFLI